MNVRLIKQRNNSPFNNIKRTVEIFLFINPFCTNCWEVIPIIKKLRVEYGEYIKLSMILTNNLLAANQRNPMKLNQFSFVLEKTAHPSIRLDETVTLPFSAEHLPFIAIKAAEFQGKHAGMKLLHQIQTEHFLYENDVQQLDTLIRCAEEAQLDLKEFEADIQSTAALKAYQSDFNITNELHVLESPTMVFFSDNPAEDGIKISGLYPYDIYTQILRETLQTKLEPATPPPIEEYLEKKPFFSTQELALVYSKTYAQIEHDLKKLLLQQKVRKIKFKDTDFWEIIT